MSKKKISRMICFILLLTPGIGFTVPIPDQPPKKSITFQIETQKAYVRLFQDLYLPYRNLIKAHFHLREVFKIEQTQWQEILKKNLTGKYPDKEEEISLREKGFPAFSAMTQGLETLLLKKWESLKRIDFTRNPASPTTGF